MKRNSVFVAFLLPVSIPLSLPFILYGITKNQSSMLYFIAIIMAILSYLSVPYDTMDLVRYYALFDSITTMPYEQIWSLQEGNIFTNMFIKLISSLGLNKQCLPMIANFISYCYFFKALIYVREQAGRQYQGVELLLFTTISLFAVGFFFGGSGIRTGIAVSFSLYGLTRLYSNNFVSFFLYMTMAIVVHFLSIIILIVCCLGLIFKRTSLLRYLFIISPLFAVVGLGSLLVKMVFLAFGSTLQSLGLYRVSYIEGEWGASFYALRNLNTFVYERIIYVLPLYIGYIYLLLVRNNSLYRQVVYMMFALTFLFFDFRTLFMRYSYFTTLLLVVLMASEYNGSSRKKMFSVIFLFGCIVYSLGSGYKYRDMFVPSWAKVLYQPTPFLFFNEVSNNDFIVREE